jgi:hypothetical protein
MRTFNVDRSPAASNSVGVGTVKDQARHRSGGLRRDELSTQSRSAIRVREIRDRLECARSARARRQANFAASNPGNAKAFVVARDACANHKVLVNARGSSAGRGIEIESLSRRRSQQAQKDSHLNLETWNKLSKVRDRKTKGVIQCLESENKRNFASTVGPFILINGRRQLNEQNAKQNSVGIDSSSVKTNANGQISNQFQCT